MSVEDIAVETGTLMKQSPFLPRQKDRAFRSLQDPLALKYSGPEAATFGPWCRILSYRVASQEKVL